MAKENGKNGKNGKDEAAGKNPKNGKNEAAEKNGKNEKAEKAYKGGRLTFETYQTELIKLQEELVMMQEHIKREGLRVAVVFEGRDASGKGGVIKRITQRLNPRVVRVVALGVPTEREQGQWYFQRYVPHLPAAGEMVLFDRSWYNRAGVENVMGFCTDSQYREFLRSCPEFERMLTRSGIKLIKYWFSISAKEQGRRLEQRMKDPKRRWKISAMDLEARARWVDYSRAKDAMMMYTDIDVAPWYVVDADHKKAARLNCIHHLLQQVDYEHFTPEPGEIPEIREDPGYRRPPKDSQKWVPAVYGRKRRKRDDV